MQKIFDNVIVVYNGAKHHWKMNWTDKYPQIKGVLLCPWCWKYRI